MYFEIYKSAANISGLTQLTNLSNEANPSWSWRLKGANHKLVASGESYKNETDCLRAIELVKGTNSSTLITEL